MTTNSISQTIESAMAAAGLNTQTGPLKSVTDTIRNALASAGIGQSPGKSLGDAQTTLRSSVPIVPTASAGKQTTEATVGEFLTLAHVNSGGSRAYKLYVPSTYDGAPAPLIVMLHGCKQNPDDFAAGTRMNELAESEGFLVAYPAQTARENGANCWNWFDTDQQIRDGVEPSLIAGIVNDIAKSHAVDASRIFVAGLSAGASMAVILGTTYPEVFAGVAAHSGLPIGAAHDLASAFAAMQGRAAASHTEKPGLSIPTIVFHGDADHTVALPNGKAIVEQAIQAHADADRSLRRIQRPAQKQAGKTVTATAYEDAEGRCRVEEWIVHGGAHAWFGGSPDGSYTDRTGPDASAQIVRFFLDQPATNSHLWEGDASRRDNG